MDTVILCGGKGVRFWPETKTVPKPLLLLKGEPLVVHIMRRYMLYGHKRFVLAVGHLAAEFIKYFSKAKCRELGAEVVLVNSGETAGTAVRMRDAMELVEGDTFFCTYGDGLANINLDELLQFHQDGDEPLTMTVVHPPGRFGEAVLRGRNLAWFCEKVAPRIWINGGYMVVSRSVLDAIGVQDNPSQMFEEEILPKLAATSKVAAYQHHYYWACVDSRKDMLTLEQLDSPWEG